MLTAYEKMEYAISLCNVLKNWQKKTVNKINKAKGNVEEENKPVSFLEEMYREKILLCDIPEVANYIEMMINYKFGEGR